MKKFDQAKEYYQKVADLDPNDPETYYSIAVIDWTQAYQRRMDERAKLGLKPTDDLKDKKDCQTLIKTIKDQNEPAGAGRNPEAAEGAGTASRLR